MNKPLEMVSGNMTAAMCVYSGYLIYEVSVMVQPQNYLLLACDASNESVQLYQLSRWVRAQGLGKKKVEDDESDSDSDVDDDEGADARSIVRDDGNCSNGSNKSEEKVDPEGESSGEKSQHSSSEENGNCGGFESDSSVEHEGGIAVQPTSENGISAPGLTFKAMRTQTDQTLCRGCTRKECFCNSCRR